MILLSNTGGNPTATLGRPSMLLELLRLSSPVASKGNEPTSPDGLEWWRDVFLNGDHLLPMWLWLQVMRLIPHPSVKSLSRRSHCGIPHGSSYQRHDLFCILAKSSDRWRSHDKVKGDTMLDLGRALSLILCMVDTGP